MMYENTQNDNKNNDHGCQAFINCSEKCGEVKPLEILREFQQLYESKINEIKDECSCTSTRLKIQMLEDWIRDLTEQNTMLVQVVEELEHEASERVSLLEDKLRNSSSTSFEIMKTLQEYDAQNITNQSDTLQRLKYFQSDVNNLTEFIRRLREDGNWNIEGLHFYNVSQEDLEIVPTSAKNLSQQKELENSVAKLKIELNNLKHKQEQNEMEMKRKEIVIKEQVKQIEKLNGVVERCATSMPDRQNLLEELHELRSQLKAKNDNYERLELSVKDMREALTTEVADKHDNLLAIRRDCQLLEERCRQADKQTHFKDDIIKEMRKELKQYRFKFGEEGKENDKDNLKKKMILLEEENLKLHKTISNANGELNILHGLIKKYYMFEECENKVLFSAKKLKSLKQSEETFGVENNDIHNLHEHLNSIERCCSELLSVTRETSDDIETMNLLRSKIHDSSDNLLANRGSESNVTDRSEGEISENFSKTIIHLKNDISKMILRKNDNELNELRKHVTNIENTQYEIKSKDLLLKNKDEMINIQNDTLNVAQKELIELREKMAAIEKDRDFKIQEIQNLQQTVTYNQNTIEQLEKVLKNAEEKANNIQQTVDLYMETINLLENAKNKAETEIEQQRITIGNLQDALVNTKQQLESFQGRSASELKEKSDIIHTLYQELDEMQSQYLDCYAENVKLSQTADCLRDANLEMKVTNLNLQQDIQELNEKIMNDKTLVTSLEEKYQAVVYTNELLEGNINFMRGEMGNLSGGLKLLQELLKMSSSLPQIDSSCDASKSLHILQDHSQALLEQLKLTQKQITREIKLNDLQSRKIVELELILEGKTKELQETTRQCEEYENKIKILENRLLEFHKQGMADKKTDEMVLTCNTDLNGLKQKIDVLNKLLNEKSNEILRLHTELNVKSDTITNIIKDNEYYLTENKKLHQNALNLEQQLDVYKSQCVELKEQYNKFKVDIEKAKQWDMTERIYKQEKKILTEKLEQSQKEEVRLSNELKISKEELNKAKINLEATSNLQQEINKLNKARNRVLAENKKLQDQIFKVTAGSLENNNTTTFKQLNKCLEELSALQSTKNKVEEKNIQLEVEIDHLQRAFAELNLEVRFKTEELSETKCSRDEICAESRLVVSNVRAWLEEQKKVNAALNSTLKEKNLIIEELSVEKNLLLKNIKDVCERYETLTEELQTYRQYLTDLGVNQDLKIVTPVKNSVYSWGSQGSVSESPSPVYVEPEQLFHNPPYICEDNDSEPNPAKWMRKVQNMSEDLLKSKKYWQTKMPNPKKLKPVKIKSGKNVTTN